MKDDQLRLNVTQDEYAQHLGVSPSTLSRFRTGTGKLSKQMRRRLLLLHPRWKRTLDNVVLEDLRQDDVAAEPALTGTAVHRPPHRTPRALRPEEGQTMAAARLRVRPREDTPQTDGLRLLLVEYVDLRTGRGWYGGAGRWSSRLMSTGPPLGQRMVPGAGAEAGAASSSLRRCCAGHPSRRRTERCW